MIDTNYLPAGPQVELSQLQGLRGLREAKTKCFKREGKPDYCITVDDCTEAWCGYVPPAKALMRRLRGFGQAGFSMVTPSWSPMPAAPTMPQLQGPWAVARGLEPPVPTKIRMFASLASAAVSAYHGTRRNGGSIFWGTVWFSLGALFPVITPVVAVAQGLGECRNNCPVNRTVNLGRGRR